MFDTCRHDAVRADVITLRCRWRYAITLLPLFRGLLCSCHAAIYAMPPFRRDTRSIISDDFIYFFLRRYRRYARLRY